MTFFTRLAVAALAVCGLASPLYAQQAQQSSQQGTTAKPFRPLLLPTVHYGAPLRFSGGLAVFLPTKEEPGFRRSGFIVEGSVGQGGVRGSFGPAGILEYLMMDARFVVCRTWNSPRDASPDSTYGGVEGGLTIAYVRVSAGVGRRLAGPTGPDATQVSWGVGFHYPFSP